MAQQRLPVRLTRLPVTSATQACGSDTYNLPLEHEALKMKVGPVRFLGQRRYRPVSIAGVQLVELIDAAPGIAAINRQLRAELPGDDEARRRQLRELVWTQGQLTRDRSVALVRRRVGSQRRSAASGREQDGRAAREAEGLSGKSCSRGRRLPRALR